MKIKIRINRLIPLVEETIDFFSKKLIQESQKIQDTDDLFMQSATKSQNPPYWGGIKQSKWVADKDSSMMIGKYQSLLEKLERVSKISDYVMLDYIELKEYFEEVQK